MFVAEQTELLLITQLHMGIESSARHLKCYFVFLAYFTLLHLLIRVNKTAVNFYENEQENRLINL